MGKRRKRHNRNRRSGHFMGIYVLFCVIVAVAAILAGSVIFFKVNHVTVQYRSTDVEQIQNGHYSEEELLEAAGIKMKDNLFLLNKTTAAAGLTNRLPYVSSVSIQKKLPDTLVLIITESRAEAAVESEDGGWWLMDVNGKLLEKAEEKGECSVVKGLTLLEPEAGKEIKVPDGSDEEAKSQMMQKDSLLGLLQPLVSYGLRRDVRTISLLSDSEAVLDYAGRIEVKIPLEADFEYKIKYFSEILNKFIPEKWSEEDTGTLDMTYEDGRPHLTKK